MRRVFGASLQIAERARKQCTPPVGGTVKALECEQRVRDFLRLGLLFGKLVDWALNNFNEELLAGEGPEEGFNGGISAEESVQRGFPRAYKFKVSGRNPRLEDSATHGKPAGN
jgi:hypothetical protein